MKYQIREAFDNDNLILDNLFAKLIETDREYDSNVKVDLTMKGFFKNRISDIDSIVLVAYIDEQVIGYIYGYVRSDNKIKIELEAYIESLFVIEEYRNQGVATSLINKFIEESKKRNVNYLFIENKVNNESAKKLYSKLHFSNFIECRRKEI